MIDFYENEIDNFNNKNPCVTHFFIIKKLIFDLYHAEVKRYLHNIFLFFLYHYSMD